MALDLRPYQQDCVDGARTENAIVVLGTGMGKTLVAVKLIDHFLLESPAKRAVFTVPTKVLVKQQAEYCEKHCSGTVKAAQLCGMEMDCWDKLKWDTCILRHQALVGTYEIFRRALEKGHLTASQISIAIIDECHNAVGKSPPAIFVKSMLASASAPPRVVGLTASFSSQALKCKPDIEGAKIDMELLFKAKMYCPDTDLASSTGSSGQSKEWTRVDFVEEGLEAVHGSEVERFLQELVQQCDPHKRIVHFHKTVRRITHVFGELGKEAFFHAMRHNVLHHLQSQAELLIAGNGAARTEAGTIQMELPQLQQNLSSFLGRERCNEVLKEAPGQTMKVRRLFRLLEETCLKLGKGIIFVTQVIMTKPLAHLIQEAVRGCRSDGVYGQMTPQDHNRVMEGFRAGAVNTLVATNTLEEGIDVPDCEWVVRFNEFATTKSHIQGSGRARVQRAKVYYFMNDPDEEEQRARIMQGVARDRVIAATRELFDLEEEREAKRRKKGEGVHPFEEPGKQDITILNGQELVYNWCQQIMGLSFSAARLPKYAAEHEGGRVLSVTIPSPDPGGEFAVTAADVERYWHGVNPKDVIDPAILRKMGRRDLDLRLALFVTAVRMRQRDWITATNEPQSVHFKSAKLRYSPPLQVERVTIGKTFAKESPEVREGNKVSALNEWAQKRWKSTKNISYTSFKNDLGWVATVSILPLEGSSFQGDPCSSKKAAEQSAAARAWEHVGRL